MITLSFQQNTEGLYEASFVAGQVNILQLMFDEQAPGPNRSLSVLARMSDDMPYQMSKLYVPCPSRIVSLPVHVGEQVKLLTPIEITKACLISETATAGGIAPEDISALAKLIEQNRIEIEAQKKVNDEQQKQIDKNTTLNADQEERILDENNIAPKEKVEDLFK